MLRSALPNHAAYNTDNSEQEQLQRKNETPLSSQVCIRGKCKKRVKLTHGEIKEKMSKTHEIKINKMKENMKCAFDIERVKLTNIDAKQNSISSIIKDLPLKEAVESFIFSCALPKDENKKLSTQLCNVVIKKTFQMVNRRKD